MAAPLKLIQLNIEIGKHLDVTVPFLEREQPDIVCLQELLEPHVEVFERAVGKGVYAPMRKMQGSNEGAGIFSRHPIVSSATYWYGGNRGEVREYDGTSYQHGFDSSSFLLLAAELDTPSGLYKVATTHFPVTEKGAATEYQRTSMEQLLAELAKQGEFVLTGDFNAPRGGEIFSKLAGIYKDNVPPQYKTSIDAKRHRNGKDHAAELADKMVDGVFSTPHYTVTNVRLVDDVSDHCAIVAEVSTQ